MEYYNGFDKHLIEKQSTNSTYRLRRILFLQLNQIVPNSVFWGQNIIPQIKQRKKTIFPKKDGLYH